MFSYKKHLIALLVFALLAVFSTTVPAQTSGGKEVPNLRSAVKAADPGDYILLPSGKKYVLTKEEIAITKGEFDYEDLSEVKTESLPDGTEIKTISESHVAYLYPDGQSTHLLKTSVSFTAFLRHIQKTYYLARYVDDKKDTFTARIIDPPSFDVFRASAQFMTTSDGIEELEAVWITAYNYEGENIAMRYCAKPGFIWGNISSTGSYRPVSETHKVEFDIE